MNSSNQATLATKPLIDNAPLQAQLVDDSLFIQADGCEFSNDSEIIADWLANLSKSTARTYWSVIKGFSSFSGGMAIALWSKKMIQAWLMSLKGRNKIATLNKKLATIRSLLNHCVMESYLERNVAQNVRKVREDKDNVERQSLEISERVIGSDEVWKIIRNASSNRDQLLLKVTYLLGLRVHEAVKIHWNDISPSGNGYKIKIIGKNNKLAFLPIDRALLSELKEISTSGYIFKSQKGNNKPLTTTQLHRIVKQSAKKSGLSSAISPHWLRHQRCSDLVNSGKFTLSQVQKFMRHSNLSTTSIYIHITDEIGSNALLG